VCGLVHRSSMHQGCLNDPELGVAGLCLKRAPGTDGCVVSSSTSAACGIGSRSQTSTATA
jgi:hypothetical protein